MNFFQAQDKARRNTGVLIILFMFAVAGLILLTNILLLGTLVYSQTGQVIYSATELKNYFQWDVFIATAIGVSLLILLGSFYKTLSLSSGGAAVAEMLGGKLVPQSTTTAKERQLLNVVEEMAIASGIAIPKVYLLDDASINAFAAGKSPNTAVIGVTHGALNQLTRDELQGVIAHEFSHIFNGDMKLNIRLIGILHGIMLIGIMGYYILRSLRYVRSSRNEKGGGIVVVILTLGVGLMVIGYAGTFFGQWIKAAVSRQREYLADASAVQFTRNKDSIAGALKKIGGSSTGSFIESPAAPEYSHAYFANGISSFWQSMFATHPPLEKRIKQIDPGWNGKFITPKPQQENKTETADKTTTKKTVAGIATTAAILTSAEQAIMQSGTLTDTAIQYAHELMSSLPESLRTASQNAYSARAVVYALLIKQQENKQEAKKLLNTYADKAMPSLTDELLEELPQLDEKLKLPLLELAINALRELSLNQYQQFRHTIHKIITADKTVDLNEWILQKLLLQQLDEDFGLRKPAKAKHAVIGAVKNEAEIILSLIAYKEHNDDALAKQAFELAKKEIGIHAFNIVSRDAINLDSLNRAMDQLAQLKPLLKPRILKACAAIILADDHVTIQGDELFRTLAICLDCPMPPIRT